jgi:hypothetical protein
VTYEFYGWRGGVMAVKGSDGILRSSLTGEAIHGPDGTKRRRRIPSMVTDWQYWLMLHPESVAYRMFAGRAADCRLRGKQLKWVNSIQCRWYAWSSEYPDTELYK